MSRLQPTASVASDSSNVHGLATNHSPSAPLPLRQPTAAIPLRDYNNQFKRARTTLAIAVTPTSPTCMSSSSASPDNPVYFYHIGQKAYRRNLERWIASINAMIRNNQQRAMLASDWDYMYCFVAIKPVDAVPVLSHLYQYNALPSPLLLFNLMSRTNVSILPQYSCFSTRITEVYMPVELRNQPITIISLAHAMMAYLRINQSVLGVNELINGWMECGFPFLNSVFTSPDDLSIATLCFEKAHLFAVMAKDNPDYQTRLRYEHYVHVADIFLRAVHTGAMFTMDRTRLLNGDQSNHIEELELTVATLKPILRKLLHEYDQLKTLTDYYHGLTSIMLRINRIILLWLKMPSPRSSVTIDQHDVRKMSEWFETSLKDSAHLAMIILVLEFATYKLLGDIAGSESRWRAVVNMKQHDIDINNAGFWTVALAILNPMRISQ